MVSVRPNSNTRRGGCQKQQKNNACTRTISKSLRPVQGLMPLLGRPFSLPPLPTPPSFAVMQSTGPQGSGRNGRLHVFEGLSSMSATGSPEPRVPGPSASVRYSRLTMDGNNILVFVLSVTYSIHRVNLAYIPPCSQSPRTSNIPCVHTPALLRRA